MDNEAVQEHRRRQRNYSQGLNLVLGIVRRHKRKAAAFVSLVLTALVGLVVTDVYGRIKDSAGGPSLSTNVVPLDNCPGGQYVFPGGFSPESLPPYEQFDTRWTYARNGSLASGVPVQVVLQGTSESTVVLLGMSIHVLTREPAQNLVEVNKCPGAGDLFPRYFTFDLDEGAFPRVRAVAGDREIPGDAADPAIDFPYTVSKSEVEAFWIIPETSSCICSWEATIQWSSEGEVHTTVVRFNSQPFKTAATTNVEARFNFFPHGIYRG